MGEGKKLGASFSALNGWCLHYLGLSQIATNVEG